MEIKPIRKIKRIKHASVRADDLLGRPAVKVASASEKQTQFGLEGGNLIFGGRDVGEWIAEVARTRPEQLAPIAGMLEEFKKTSLQKRGRGSTPKAKVFWGRFLRQVSYTEAQLSQIFALCDGYIARVAELIKRRFDETKDGLSIAFDENNQLILNGMNIHAYVENCRENLNPKSLTFLQGIRTRLEHVLENKSHSRNFERLEDVIKALFAEIDEILRK